MTEAERYEANVGRPPTSLPDDHPYKWQWDYRGTKKEREQLPELLGWEDEGEPVVIDGQEEMF